MGIGAVKRRAVFLDRDGVLNRNYLWPDGKTHPPVSLAEVELLSGVAQACDVLRAAGYLLIVVTNQPDVARGTQEQSVVEAINRSLRDQLALDAFYVCYHDNRDGCGCRKPQPGLLLQAAEQWGIDLHASFMVGDRMTDVEAGRRAGCRAILISEGDLASQDEESPDFCATALHTAVGWILGQHEHTLNEEQFQR